MPIDIGLTTSGLVSVDESETFTAPLPTVGLQADFAIAPKWFLRSSFEVFYAGIKEYDGWLYNSQIALEYIPWKHLGFGLAFDVFRVSIESDGEDYPGIDFKGELDFTYSGLLFYVKVPF
jgi:hypothetical protein